MSGEASVIDPAENDHLRDDVHIGIENNALKLAEVKDHQSAMTERYGDDPSKCPFLNSMGSAGIELYQRIKQNADNPDRGPTMGELMEARKRQDVPDKKPEEQKPLRQNDEETQRILARHIEPTEERALDTELNLLANDRAVPEELKKEREVLLHEIFKDVDTSEEALVENNKPEHNAPKTDGTFSPQLEITKPKVQEAQRPAILTAEAAIEPISLPVEPVKSIPVYKTEQNVKELVPPEQLRQPEILPAMAAELSPAPLYNETRPEIVIDEPVELTMPMEELAGSFDMTPESLDELELLEQVIGGDLDSKIPLDPFEAIEQDAVVSTSEDLRELKTIETEPPIPKTLQEQIITYVELLPDDESEEPKKYLNELTELVAAVNELVELTPEIEVALIEEAELVLVKLLDSIKLNLDERVIKAMASILILGRTTTLKSASKYTTDQLNRMGTQEYKPNSPQPILTSLLQSLMDKLEARLNIGKYALKASFA